MAKAQALAILFSFLAVVHGQIACSHTTTRPLVHGELILPLALLISRPEVLPSGQEVLVQGYLSRGFGLHLFLTSEHAAGLDISSSIDVSDPTEDGSLYRSDCFERFVRVSGTFVRRPSGEVTIQSPTEIVYLSEEAQANEDWAHLFVRCWPIPGAA